MSSRWKRRPTRNRRRSTGIDADKEQISAHVEHGVLNVEIPKIQKAVIDEAKKVIEVK